MSAMTGRYLAVCVVVVAMVGCGSTKRSATIVTPTPATTTTSTTTDEAFSFGRVTNGFANDGCPWLISIEKEGSTIYLIPIALDDQYKKDGLHLKFTYRPSKASSGGCMKGQPAILEGITIQ